MPLCTCFIRITFNVEHYHNTTPNKTLIPKPRAKSCYTRNLEPCVAEGTHHSKWVFVTCSIKVRILLEQQSWKVYINVVFWSTLQRAINDDNLLKSFHIITRLFRLLRLFDTISFSHHPRSLNFTAMFMVRRFWCKKQQIRGVLVPIQDVSRAT